jgi:hypothetical protein
MIVQNIEEVRVGLRLAGSRQWIIGGVDGSGGGGGGGGSGGGGGGGKGSGGGRGGVSTLL